MKPAAWKIVVRLSAVLLLGVYVSELLAEPPLESGDAAEVTDDGLHRVDLAVMDAAWVREGLDLTPYKKLLILPTGISFRTPGESDDRPGVRDSGTEYPVSDEAKVMFRRVFGESFDADVASVERYELSDVPARDVLLVQGFLVDFVSSIPPERDILPGARLTLRWEGTIVLELRDSMSNEMLARTVERERMERLTGAGLVWAERERLMRRWSRLLRTRLEKLSEIASRDEL